METELFVLLFQPGEFFAPRSVVTHPELILQCEPEQAKLGNNALFHCQDDLIADRVFTKDTERPFGPSAYQFHYFDSAHRAKKSQSKEIFNEVFESVGSSYGFEDLMPAVAVQFDKDSKSVKLYHFNDTAYHGTIFLKYAEMPWDAEASGSGWTRCVNALEQAYPRLLKYRHLLNDTCWYTRWKHDMELERKYTFKNIPDTWALNTALYHSINLEGKLPGFVPELDMDIQVFDYDNHLFEVIEPASKGYISFIPQTNGKVVVKQKWFEENTELRKETIHYDCELSDAEFETKAMELAQGEVKRMAPFRRKRFDVNFESLDTGNIFGVYFDICRNLEEPEKYAFSQCEVEYCRSRTMFDFQKVMDEYEVICAYVKDFLTQKGMEFEQDLFSKLDFARNTYLAQQQEGK